MPLIGPNLLLLIGSGSTISTNYPDGLLETYRQYFLATPDLVAAFNGSIFFGEAPTGSLTPTLVVTELANVPYFQTGNNYYEVETLSFTIHGSPISQVKLAGRTLMRYTDRFWHAQMQDGLINTAVRKPSRFMQDPDRAAGSKIFYNLTIDYDVYVSKSLTPF